MSNDDYDKMSSKVNEATIGEILRRLTDGIPTEVLEESIFFPDYSDIFFKSKGKKTGQA